MQVIGMNKDHERAAEAELKFYNTYKTLNEYYEGKCQFYLRLYAHTIKTEKQCDVAGTIDD